MSYRVSLEKTDPLDPDRLRAAVNRAVDRLGDPLAGLGPESVVLIKPNITIGTIPWEQGVVTNPHLVRAIVEAVRERSPKQILIAEAIAVGLSVGPAFDFLGYPEIARETGAQLVDLYDHEFVGVPVVGGLHDSLEVAGPILAADLVINVPVLKTHVAVGVTAAMKNLMGTVSVEQKKRFHFFGLAESIVDLNSVVKPGLTIVDGTIAGEGDGPIGNTPVGLGLILAGTDCRAVDLVGARVMGFEPREVGVLAKADERWGEIPEDSIDLRGEPLEKVARPFKRVAETVRFRDGVETVTGRECRICNGVADLTLGRAEELGMLDRLTPLKILCGPAEDLGRPDERTLIIGQCLEKYRDHPHYVPGCPPQVFLATDQLKEMLGEERVFGPKEGFTFPTDD